MIFTSNFSKNGYNENAVAICGKSPEWYFGKEYKKLAPKYWFFVKYKQDRDEEFYIKNYYAEVLSQLDPKKVYEELDGKILLCYEKETDFCHRFLVADWLEYNLGIKVDEI
jgi:uncharacterized protein (DUF488 family)